MCRDIHCRFVGQTGSHRLSIVVNEIPVMIRVFECDVTVRV